ncbi:MAG: hypothetical protein KDD33_13220 [Bdellovibrionales bacterium]|nr:hypothetical protein [Bdellovibrionales bacterium]
MTIKVQTIPQFLLSILIFALFFWGAQAEDQKDTINEYKSVLAQNVPEPILRMMVNQMTNDMFKMGEIGFEHDNGGKISPEARKALKDSENDCKEKLDATNINEFRKALDVFNGGKGIEKIFDTLPKNFNDCMVNSKEAVRKADPKARFRNDMTAFKEWLKDPEYVKKVREETLTAKLLSKRVSPSQRVIVPSVKRKKRPSRRRMPIKIYEKTTQAPVHQKSQSPIESSEDQQPLAIPEEKFNFKVLTLLVFLTFGAYLIFSKKR